MAELVNRYLGTTSTIVPKIKRRRDVNCVATRPRCPVVFVLVRLDDSHLRTGVDSWHQNTKVASD